MSYILHTKSGNPNFEGRAGGGGSQGWRPPQENQGWLEKGDQRDGVGSSPTELPSPSVSLGWTNSPLRAQGEASAATCWGAEARRHSDLPGAGHRGDRTSRGRGQRGGGAGEILLLPGGRSEPLATVPHPLTVGCGRTPILGWPASLMTLQSPGHPFCQSHFSFQRFFSKNLSDSSEQKLGEEQEASTTFLFTLLTATEPTSDPAE